jgi:hypothetical protein
MCDYSLAGVPNRLVVEGEPLVVHRFSTGTMGLASPLDLVYRQPHRRSWWSAARDWLLLSPAGSVCAVCIPPGARLVVRNIPERLQLQLGIGPEEEAQFIQLSATAFEHRDALQFSSGRTAKLQELPTGLRMDVVSVAEATERELPPVEDGLRLSHR